MTPLAKRLLIALAISGALNLLCAGLFVGGAIRRHRLRDERAHAGPGMRGIGPRGQGEPRAGRREGGPRARREGPFSGLLAEHRDEMMARRRATAEARQAVEQSLLHEPFDAAALEHALATLRSETETTQELLHKTVLETAKGGDADTRSKLAHGFGALAPPAL